MKTRETEVKVEKNEATVPMFSLVVFVVKASSVDGFEEFGSIPRPTELRYEVGLNAGLLQSFTVTATVRGASFESV